MLQKSSSDTKFKIRITHNLISFRNEIDYVLSVLNKWLYIDFAVINDKKSSEVQISEIMSSKFRWVDPTTTIGLSFSTGIVTV